MSRSPFKACFHLASLVLQPSNRGSSLLFMSTGRSTTRHPPSSMCHALSSSEELMFSSDTLDVYHARRTVGSTQDEIKRFLESNQDKQALALIADSQSKGRGTGGRAWHASDGNLYMTCAIAASIIPLSSVTLLPLGIGVRVAELLSQYSNARPVVKWPNDVLLDGCKVSGTLIENHDIDGNGWWLVGVGVNIDSHPHALIPEQNDFPGQVPRAATSLKERAKTKSLPAPKDLGLQLACHIETLCRGGLCDPLTVAEEWRQWAELESPYQLRETGETVVALGLESDGRLRVLGQDGKERLLVADYLT